MNAVVEKVKTRVNNMQLLTGDGFAVWLLCLIALMLRMYRLFTCENFLGSTPAGRILGALAVIKAPSPFRYYQVVFNVVHPYLLAITIKMSNDLTLAPRILSIVCGVLLVIPFYYWIKVSTKNGNIAFFSSIVLCVYPLHVLYSTITMAEAPFYLFLFSSFYFFMLYRNNSSTRVFALIISAILLGVASLTRYEGLMFIPLYGIFLWNEHIKHKLIFLVLVSLGPVFLMFLNYYYFNDPMYFLNVSDNYSNVEIVYHKTLKIGIWYHYSTAWRKFFCWLYVLMKTLSPPVVYYGLFGLVYSCVRRKNLFLCALFLFAFTIMTYKIFNETLLVNIRYSLTLGLLLIPLSVIGVDVIARVLTRRFSFFFCSVLVLWFSMVAVGMIKQETVEIPGYAKNISFWLQQRVGRDEVVVLDKDPIQVYYTTIPLLSGLESRQIWLAPQNIAERDRVLNSEKLIGMFSCKQVKYVVIHEEGYLLADILGEVESDDRFVWHGYLFKKIYESGPYKIYSLAPSKHNGME